MIDRITKRYPESVSWSPRADVGLRLLPHGGLESTKSKSPGQPGRPLMHAEDRPVDLAGSLFPERHPRDKENIEASFDPLGQALHGYYLFRQESTNEHNAVRVT